MKTAMLPLLSFIALLGLAASAFAELPDDAVERSKSFPSHYLENPELSDRVSSRFLYSSDFEFDGVTTEDWIHRDDQDGRIFTHSFLRPFGRPDGPRWEHKWRLVLDDAGISWITKRFPAVPSLRYVAVLHFLENPDKHDPARVLQKRVDGSSIVYSLGSVYIVAPEGFLPKCRKPLLRECAASWKRVKANDLRDPSDL